MKLDLTLHFSVNILCIRKACKDSLNPSYKNVSDSVCFYTHSAWTTLCYDNFMCSDVAGEVISEVFCRAYLVYCFLKPVDGGLVVAIMEDKHTQGIFY